MIRLAAKLPRQKLRRCRGFTLLEVMVALAIVSLSLVTLVAGIGQMVDAANAMRERTYASWIAQNKIAELRLSNTVPDVSTSSGEVDYANTLWAWRAVVTETGVENLFRVDVAVLRPETDALVFTVTGFIGEPTIPGQSNRSWSRGPQGTGVRE
jgi:general secretion pathway protein I